MRKTLSLIFVIALLALVALNAKPAMANTLVKIGGGMKWYTGPGFEWTIVKSADQTNLTLSPGQLFPVNYSVTVNATSGVVSYGTIGQIVIGNIGSPTDVTINSAVVVMPDNTEVPATCLDTVLSLNETTLCVTAPTALPDDSYQTVTFKAVVTIDGNQSTFTAPDYIDFSDLGRKANYTPAPVDECVEVSDTNVGVLGTVCSGDAPKTFTYTLNFGTSPDADVVVECGENTHTNIASFVTNDTGATGSDDAVVTTTVACGGGCSLTQGYWKTHSSYGPASYDDTWAMIGEDTIFFLSGQSWISVFNTAPAGNPYYILAHQYMAAVLNQLNGASVPAAVQTAINDAQAFFSVYGPNAVLTKEQKQAIIALALVLDNYNNGVTGPGHCSE